MQGTVDNYILLERERATPPSGILIRTLLEGNYDSRKEARAGEIESLKNAKAVLSGADFALVQTAVRRSLRGL